MGKGVVMEKRGEAGWGRERGVETVGGLSLQIVKFTVQTKSRSIQKPHRDYGNCPVCMLDEAY